MQKVYALIQKAAETKDFIYITGETGTGKHTCGQAIHYYSNQEERSFRTIENYNNHETDSFQKQTETFFF